MSHTEETMRNKIFSADSFIPENVLQSLCCVIEDMKRNDDDEFFDEEQEKIIRYQISQLTPESLEKFQKTLHNVFKKWGVSYESLPVSQKNNKFLS